jgi:hypothetical protein
MKMIDNVSLYFFSSKRFISEIILFMYRLSIQLYNIWKTPTTHLNTKTFIEKFCKDLSERMKHVNLLIWKAMLLNLNCLSIFDFCILLGWTIKIDLKLYVLEIEESLKSFKVSKNNYEKFIQSKRMSYHQSSIFFENINQIIGSNDFFNLENEISHDEWMCYLVFIKDPLNANLSISDILKNENYYFLRVKQLIQNLCCMQPAAIDCECQWSTASIIDHKLRNKIKSQNFITILFLKGYSMLWVKKLNFK